MMLLPLIAPTAVAYVQMSSKPSEMDIEKAVSCISNDDFSWSDGGPFTGVYPSPSRNARIVLEMGEPSKQALLRALKNPNAFIAAHCLLALIFHDENSHQMDSWNGLRVRFSWDGSSTKVIIDPAQINEINKKWEAFFARTPNPSPTPVQ